MNPTTTLESKVAQFKNIARNALRMNLISNRLTKISALENEIQNTLKTIENYNHNVLVESYEIEHSDKLHPNYQSKITQKQKNITENTKIINSYQENIKYLNSLITKEKEGISKIESEETKVSLEELNTLVEKLILQDAKNQTSTQ